MVILVKLFISISISFQNLEPENPRTKIKKCCQNEQLKFINTIYNQLNIWNYMKLVKLATPPPAYSYKNFVKIILFTLIMHTIHESNIYISFCNK